MNCGAVLRLPAKTRSPRTQIYRTSWVRSTNFWQISGQETGTRLPSRRHRSRAPLRTTKPQTASPESAGRFSTCQRGVAGLYLHFKWQSLLFEIDFSGSPAAVFPLPCRGAFFVVRNCFKFPVSSRARAKRCRSRRAKPTVSKDTGGFDQRRPMSLQPREDRWGF